MCLTLLAVARAAVLACCRVLACLNDSDAFHAIAMLHAGMHLVEVALLKSCEDPLVLSSNASKASLKGPPCSAFHAATQLCRTTISLTDGTFARSNRSEVLYRSGQVNFWSLHCCTLISPNDRNIQIGSRCANKESLFLS